MNNSTVEVDPCELAAHLRECAARLEDAARLSVLPAEGSDALAALRRWHAALRRLGTRAGLLLDEAFASGLIEWEHYTTLKADEQCRHRNDEDWHYRLFLATAGEVAASDAETGRVLIPGFLTALAPHSSAGRQQQAGCAGAYAAAIRRIATMIEARAGTHAGRRPAAGSWRAAAPGGSPGR